MYVTWHAHPHYGFQTDIISIQHRSVTTALLSQVIDRARVDNGLVPAAEITLRRAWRHRCAAFDFLTRINVAYMLGFLLKALLMSLTTLWTSTSTSSSDSAIFFGHWCHVNKTVSGRINTKIKQLDTRKPRETISIQTISKLLQICFEYM